MNKNSKSSKKSRSKSKSKDNTELKRPLNPYLLFSADYRAEREGEKITAKELGEAWNGLSSKKKKKKYRR